MEDGKKLEDKEQLSGQKNQNQEQTKYRHHFQVKYIPKGLFQLFNKNEEYIYEKKFSCELPKNIITPKSFHYPFSLENFCQSDLLTMDFDLKKNREILTDPKINTFIHQDFINNSLELIFPNLTTISKKRTDEEQNFKKKIIEIIENNDEVSQDYNPALDEIPDFLRRQTYLRPSTAVNNEKKTKNKEKTKPEKKGKLDLIKIIDQSFNDIDKIKIGMKHPDPKQKGVTAKNIYEISPMDDMPNIKFVEYLFPSEPSEVPNLNEKYLKPDHFLIRTNKTDKNDNNNNNDNPTHEETCSLYINNKLKTQEDHTQIDNAEYYTYEKEFIPSKMNQNDLFNRYFLILDKKQKKLKIAPLSDKFSFRRYKKMAEVNNDNNTKKEENDGNNNNANNTLNKKRKRDIEIIPQSISKEEIDKKKDWLKTRGYATGFTERKITKVDHADVIEIEKEREKELLEEELKNQEMNENEEDDFLNDEEGNEDNENNDDFDFDDNDDNDVNEEKSNKDENEEEQNSNEDNNNDNDNEEKENEESLKDNEDNKNKDDEDEEDKDENNNNEHEHNKNQEEENEEDKLFDSNDYHK